MLNRNSFYFFSELLALSVVFFLGTLIYGNLDPADMRILGIFPWDSGIYHEIAIQLSHGNFNALGGMYPFAPRILFPILYASLSNIFGISFIDAAYYLNLFSAYLVVIFTFVFWRKYGINSYLSWIGILLYLVSWLGPLRYAGYYPGGGFAFETALVCLLFLILAYTPKSNLLFIGLSAISVFILAIGREFVAYIIIFITVTKFLVCDYQNGKVQKYFSGENLLSKAIDILKNRSYLSLVTLSVASLIGYVTAKVLVSNIGGKYSVIKTIFNFAWIHLHPGEFLYPIFYALGPFALSLIIVLSFKRTRTLFTQALANLQPNLDLIILFGIIGFIFCMTGGTDSDRFLLWFFPFYGMAGLMSLSILLSSHSRRAIISVALILVTGLFWSRFYVPAIPHLIFPGDSYNSYAGVRTNFDPNLYFGPDFMKSYRKPLKELEIADAYSGIVIDSPPTSGAPPQISASIEKNYSGHPFKGSYKLDINIIPFPFGYMHNQYEFLTAHPTHGDHSVRITLLIQWLLAYLFILTLIAPSLRIKTKL